MDRALRTVKSNSLIPGHSTALTHVIASLLVLLVMTLAEAEGAEFRIQPALTIGEEYNDNIFLVPENTHTDYITRVVPSFDLKYKAPLWDWDVNYAYDYRYYEKGTIKNDSTHALNLRNHTTIMQDV